MPITLFRVINQQTIIRSILLDKLDDGQANTEGYAQRAKQKVYVPYVNPLDTAVKGYTDLVPTDRVLLSTDRGTIKGLSDEGRVSFFAFSSSLIAAPVVTSAVNAVGFTTIGGTTFLSVTPDLTYVTFTNLVGVTQVVPQSAFGVHTATSIVIADGVITIGVPGVGWKVQVKANSRNSNLFTL